MSITLLIVAGFLYSVGCAIFLRIGQLIERRRLERGLKQYELLQTYFPTLYRLIVDLRKRLPATK